MKKNRMMRLASGLLVAVLLSTCTISGTFAKYVTEGSASDSARVAKWGVSVKADYTNLFENSYATTDAWEGDSDNVSVKAEVDVVAPGTSGTLADFTVTGTPEVDVAVTYTAGLKFENWNIASGEYCPIVIQVNGTNYYIGQTIGGVTIEGIKQLETAVEAAIVDSAKKYNANTDLSIADNVAADLAVSWHWMFTGDTRPNNNGYQTDGKDTEIGNWSSKGKAQPSISLEASCTVTQID